MKPLSVFVATLSAVSAASIPHNGKLIARVPAFDALKPVTVTPESKLSNTGAFPVEHEASGEEAATDARSTKSTEETSQGFAGLLKGAGRSLHNLFFKSPEEREWDNKATSIDTLMEEIPNDLHDYEKSLLKIDETLEPDPKSPEYHKIISRPTVNPEETAASENLKSNFETKVETVLREMKALGKDGQQLSKNEVAKTALNLMKKAQKIHDDIHTDEGRWKTFMKADEAFRSANTQLGSKKYQTLYNAKEIEMAIYEYKGSQTILSKNFVKEVREALAPLLDNSKEEAI